MTKEESETRADAVLAEMRGGSICDVTPERSRRIVAEALRGAEERGRTLGEPGDEAAAVRAVLRVGMKRNDGAPMSEDESQLAAVLEARTSAARTTAFIAGKKAGAAEEREACARIAEGHDTTENPECVTANEIAEQIRARGAASAPSVVDLLIGVYPNGPGAEVRTFATAEQVREAYGPEVRGPDGEPWNATAAAVDAMADAPRPIVAFTPKSTAGMTPEEAEAAKAREREAFPLRVVRPMGVPTSPAELAEVRAFLARHDPAGEVTATPLPDEPFPWDAPAEGFGVKP